MSTELQKAQSVVGRQELVLDTDKDPWLLDHQFQSMTIAPGAVLVASLLDVNQKISDIKFSNMIPISSSMPVKLESVREKNLVMFRSADGLTEYATATCGAGHGTETVSKKIQESDSANNEVLDISGAQLYSRLRGQGNVYGESFQSLGQIRLSGSNNVAQWQVSGTSANKERLTVLLDSLTHFVAALGEVSSSYFLTSFQSVDFNGSVDIPTCAIIRSTGVERENNSFRGDFEIFDSDNMLLATVKGVEISVNNFGQASESIAVASTFTIDPLIDVFDFWSQQLGVKFVPRLTDYGQLIQSLLSSQSALSDKVKSKVLLVRLEDLVHKRSIENKSNKISFASELDTRELPDGRIVAQLNKYETDYLFQEIFVDHAYKRHNMRILDGDTVIDIGANIGFFSLFAAAQAKDVKIVAIEPSPVVLPILKANLAAYSPGSIVIEGGASSATGQAEFTAYRKSSVFSSFSANTEEDRDAIAKVVRNTLEAGGHTDQAIIDTAVDELMADRMESEQFICNLISVSDVIDREGLTKIGLLKIDAEKSEEAIVAGIRDEHWPLIEQVVVEIHLQSGSKVNTILDKLHSEGFVCIEDEEELLEDSGLVTVYAMRPERIEKNSAENSSEELKQSANLLIDSVDQFVHRTESDIDLVLCPTNSKDPDLTDAIGNASEFIKTHFKSDRRVSCYSSAEYANAYPVEQIFDPVADIQGHIPYTSDWYTALSTSMIRRHVAKVRMPYKVLVLDCDNTIWNGVVGEVGESGIQFDKNNLALMNIAVECKKSGMLICLASKNDKETVKGAFLSREKDMPLKWEDVVSVRINWNPKSENIRELADELNLGLDSFIFVDDSPIECADVQVNCPDVFVVELSANENWSSLFTHLWPLDRFALTAEDANRSDMYRHERKRMQYKSSTASLQEFIDGLNLRLEICSVDGASIERASQMTMRTNQFNFTTVRRSISEINALIAEGYLCDVVSVEDRFGDYGITGLLIYRYELNKLIVDTFLLSCRVLGRGVEHKLVSYLANKDSSEFVDSLIFNYVKTEKNEPARRFLSSLPGDSALTENVLELPILDAKSITLSTGGVSKESDENLDEAKSVTGTKDNLSSLAISAQQYLNIASTLRSVGDITNEITSGRRKPRPVLDTLFVAPTSPNERLLSDIWCEMLGYEKIGINDSFFELGGTSLRAVKLVSQLAGKHGFNISVVSIFEKPTVSGLASVLGGTMAESNSVLLSESGKARGHARREARKKRQARSTR